MKNEKRTTVTYGFGDDFSIIVKNFMIGIVVIVVILIGISLL